MPLLPGPAHGPRRRAVAGERGAGTLEYVGVLVLVAVVVVALTPQRESVVSTARTAWCLITSAGASTECGSAALAPAQPGGPGGPGGPGTGPEDAPDDPTPPTTGPVPPPDPENPDNPECRDVLPTSGPLDSTSSTRVRVGCRELWVPEQCAERWRAYVGATAGEARGQLAGPLAECITAAYDSMEPTCTTSSRSTVTRSEMRFLFVRFGGSQGMLVEQLGDGRVRIHLVEGAETGGGASGSVGSFSFDVAGLSGYSTDSTYEFADLRAAQDWVDWYGTYSKAKARYDAAMNAGCLRYCGGALGQQRKKAKEELEAASKDEPPHHGLAEADARTSKVTLSGGVELPLQKKGDRGEAGGAPSVSGDYTGEVTVEDRRWSDGSRTATYTSSDAGGFLVAASLGGKGLKKNDDEKKNSGGGGAGKGGVGAAFTGKTSTTVAWGKDGELSKLIVAVDDQVLKELFSAGVDVEATLPYGFAVSGGYTHTEKKGEASVTELVLDFTQHPELREVLGPRIDMLFPRDEDGNLKKKDVHIDVDEVTGDGEIHDVLAESANVRRLDYDVTETEDGGEIGVGFKGIDLFKTTWTTVENERALSGSSFEITDVEGDRRTVSPTPRCKDEPFETPKGYYTTDFSDPPAVPAREV
ncbi:hypothetical protein [Phycicoccus flavus]|uniref:hypothetical protein n=1 Tax=Phycicoccus flavus TaxID=2502783 RepID=UPI000FEB8EB3|nr:hypothetical protein [Phycicoccus flavus]NHA66910.1 hypothetical protein [Phycicoccus flavus]